jgi:hypothetical protein
MASGSFRPMMLLAASRTSHGGHRCGSRERRRPPDHVVAVRRSRRRGIAPLLANMPMSVHVVEAAGRSALP